MTTPKRLPPKGAKEATAATTIMSQRFRHDEDPQPEAAPTTPAPAVTKTASTATPRGDAEGMTRRTYYLAAADADALEDAVARIHKRLSGAVPKHRILGAIIAEGLDNLDAITKRLKNELVAGLD